MRWALLAAVAVSISGSQSAPPPSRVPVVVELFTSEGCSSCPPADQLLSTKEQPVPGVQIIALGMHVTYWDQLGWKDPASLKAATERQHGYGRVFGEDRIYTPQVVVDGRDEVVGSDESTVKRSIAKAARQPHARVGLRPSLDGDTLALEATIADLPADAKEPLEAWVVVTEDGLMTVVKRGENGGRTLRHDATVRLAFSSDVAAAGRRGFHADLRPEWRRERLKAVVVVQGKRTRHVYGAATASLGGLPETRR